MNNSVEEEQTSVTSVLKALELVCWVTCLTHLFQPVQGERKQILSLFTEPPRRCEGYGIHTDLCPDETAVTHRFM